MMKRILAVVAIALLLSVGATAKAQTASELQVLIADLQAKIAALTGGSVAQSSGYTFNTNLTVGSTGADVEALQGWLSSKGFLSIPAGTSKGYFGQLTKTAVVAYQASVGLPATGFVGPQTRAKLNVSAPVVTTPGTGTPSTPGTLSGGEGELTNFDTIGGVESTVDEGAEEQVLGVEYEAEDSDVAVERVDVDFDLSAASGSNKLEDYIDSVSLVIDGKEVADADVDEADEDDDVYSFRFSGLNAIVKENAKAEIYVVVTAVNNVDSDDEATDIDVSIPVDGIRAVDAAGISETYVDSTDDLEETFSIETRTGGDLDVTEASESPDTSTVQVDTDSDTDDVTLFVMDLEADEQDIEITDLPIYITATGAGVGEIIKEVKLVQGSKTLDTVSLASTTVTGRSIVFEDIDLTIGDGDTETLKVVATINDIEGAFSTGDKVYVSATSSALWDAEDEEGDQITLSHSLTGSNITFRSTGVMVKSGTKTEGIQSNAGDITTDDQGKYTIEFEVEAFEDTAYVLLGSATRGGASTTTAANYYIESAMESFAATTSGSVNAEVTRVSGGSEEGSYVRINTGSKATFKLTVYYDPAVTSLYRLQLQSVNFNDTAAAPDSSEAVSPLEDFQTSSVSVPN